jgi:hypothetical protein
VKTSSRQIVTHLYGGDDLVNGGSAANEDEVTALDGALANWTFGDWSLGRLWRYLTWTS